MIILSRFRDPNREKSSMSRSTEQLGSVEAIRKQLRQKLASGELRHGDAIGVRTLTTDDGLLDWRAIITTLKNYHGAAVVKDPIIAGLPAMIPFFYKLTYSRKLDDLIVKYDYALGVAQIAQAIKLDVQRGMSGTKNALRSGEHMVTSALIGFLPKHALFKLLRDLNGWAVPSGRRKPVATLHWRADKGWFNIIPIQHERAN